MLPDEAVEYELVVGAVGITFEPTDACGEELEVVGVDGIVYVRVHGVLWPAETFPLPLFCCPCTSLSALQAK